MGMTVQDWQDEIERGLEYREKYSKESTWSEIENAFYNERGSCADEGPNLIMSEGDSILSSLDFHPEFLLEPEDAQSVVTAPVVESLENRLAKKEYLNIKSVVDEANLNAYLYGLGIIKIGYDSEFGWDIQFDIGTASVPFGVSRTQFSKQGKRIEYKNVRPGYPWCKAVLPHDIVVPWGSGTNVDDLPWIAHRVPRSNVHIRKDPKYSNTKNLEPQISMQMFMESYQNGGRLSRRGAMRKPIASASNDPVLFNELWEIHDRENQEVIVITFDYEKFLRKQNDSLQAAIGGLPFVAGSLVRRSRCFWAPPLAYFLLQHQADMKDIYVQAGKQRRINVAKFLMLGGAMDNTETQKLISGDVGAVAQTKVGAGKQLSDIFMAFPKGNNYDLMVESKTVRMNAKEVTGHSNNQAGEFDASTRRTATEASIVSQGASNRMSPKQNMTADLYTECMRKSVQLCFAFWRTPRQILVGNDWMVFTGAQLQGHYSYYTNLVEKANLTKFQRTAQALQMIGTLAQFPNIDLAKAEAFITRAVNDPGFTGFFPAAQSQPMLPAPNQQGQAGGIQE